MHVCVCTRMRVWKAEANLSCYFSDTILIIIFETKFLIGLKLGLVKPRCLLVSVSQ